MHRAWNKVDVCISRTPPDKRAGRICQPSSAKRSKEKAGKSQRDLGIWGSWNCVGLPHHSQSTTKETPFSLVYGSDAMIPVEIQEKLTTFSKLRGWRIQRRKKGEPGLLTRSLFFPYQGFLTRSPNKVSIIRYIFTNLLYSEVSEPLSLGLETPRLGIVRFLVSLPLAWERKGQQYGSQLKSSLAFMRQRRGQ